MKRIRGSVAEGGARRRGEGFAAYLGLGVTLAVVGFFLPGCQPAEEIVVAEAEPVPAVAPADGIRHRLSFVDKAQHYVEVEATFPSPEAELELMMAVWTPGSYKVREYSRHVEALSATTLDGRPVGAVKSAKNRWRLEAGEADEVVVRYRVYGREMTVRTNFVDADFAVLNGAPTFLTPVGELDQPHRVELQLPSEWSGCATGLAQLESECTFLATDFDDLVDSPIVVGDLERHSFEVEGVPHEIVHFGDLARWDLAKSARDVEILVREQIDFWGTIPYPRYVFLNGVVDAGGGLEHKNSTLMYTGRFSTETRQKYVRWLGLVSHEFFHTWNVKRLRPKALGPFDYETENHTESLWIAEGLTSYYGPLLMHRAELIDDEEYLESLSRGIKRLQETPGRGVRSLSESSFDAWIKHYIPDENSLNTAISYYTKGQVVGWLLDAEIRRRTRGERSLDRVMRAASEKYSGDHGFLPGDFRRLIEEETGEDLSPSLAHWVDSTEELDYTDALKLYGLQFQAAKGSEGDDGEDADPIPGWLGFRSTVEDGRLLVEEVPRGTPAYGSGLNAEDEILAIDGTRVSPENWQELMDYFPPGQEATLLITRRGQVRELGVTLGEEPDATWQVEVDPEANARQKKQLKAWWTGS